VSTLWHAQLTAVSLNDHVTIITGSPGSVCKELPVTYF